MKRIVFALLTVTGCYAQTGVGLNNEGRATYNVGAGLSIPLGKQADARLMLSGAVSRYARSDGDGTVTGGIPVLGIEYRIRRFGDGSVTAPALVLSGDLHGPFGAIEFRERAVMTNYAMRTYLGAAYEIPFNLAATADADATPWGFLRLGGGPELYVSDADAFGTVNTIGAAATVSFTTQFGATIKAIDCWVRKQCE